MLFDKEINSIIHPGDNLSVEKYFSDDELKDIFLQSGLTILKETTLDYGSYKNGYLENKVYILK